MKPLEVTPPTRRSLPETVSEQLEDLILGPGLGPGDRLPAERELAERLGVSRIVVREALRVLVERGLIEVRPGVGTFVATMPEDAVTGPLGLYIRRHEVAHAHLFEVRRALEPRMAATAARMITRSALDEMRDNVARTFQLVAKLAGDDADAEPIEDTVEAFAWADLEFHELLARAGDNPLYGVLLAPLIDPLLAVRLQGARIPGAAQEAARGHRAVLDAVERRDSDAAANTMAAHLDQVASWLEPPRGPSASTGHANALKEDPQ